MRPLFALFGLFCFAQTAFAQPIKAVRPLNDSLPRLVLFDFAYGAQMPVGHLAQRFKLNISLTQKGTVYTSNNWGFGWVGSYQFGEEIREDVIAPLRDASGYVIDKTGVLNLAQLQQRGFYLGVHGSRLISLGAKRHRRSGIDIQFSGGYWQHWIRIRTFGKDMVQLQGDYKKGYDRKSSGLGFEQFIGYRYLSDRKLINLFIGITATEGFIQNRRAWNYDTREADNKTYFDVLLGIRGGISIPIYIYGGKGGEVIYFY